MNIDFNWIDLGFLIIFLLSIIFGFFSGFIRGIVSLIFLIAAVYLAVRFSPQLAEHLAGSATREGTGSYLLLIGIFFVIFIVTIIIGAFVSYYLNLAFQLGGLGFTNSFLGGLFGIVRAALLTIVIIYVVQLLPAGKEPVWRESKIVAYFQPMTDWLVEKVSPTLETLKKHLNRA